jgi:hypothetical protein
MSCNARSHTLDPAINQRPNRCIAGRYVIVQMNLLYTVGNRNFDIQLTYAKSRQRTAKRAPRPSRSNAGDHPSTPPAPGAARPRLCASSWRSPRLRTSPGPWASSPPNPDPGGHRRCCCLPRLWHLPFLGFASV